LYTRYFTFEIARIVENRSNTTIFQHEESKVVFICLSVENVTSACTDMHIIIQIIFKTSQKDMNYESVST